MNKNVSSFFLSPPPEGSANIGKERSSEIFVTAMRKIKDKEVEDRLSEEEFNTIREVIRKEIHIDPKRNHKLVVTVLAKDKFSIVIDNKAQFFVSRQTPQQERGIPGKYEKILVIQEKFEKRTLFSHFNDFFGAILNLFYKPSFPDTVQKNRMPREAIKQDYHTLRKGLESGRTWLDPKDRILVNSAEQTQRAILLGQVDQSVANGKKIERALNSRNPEKALEHLSEEWADYVHTKLEGTNEFIIPVGYLNNENVLQPVMLRFFRDQETHRLRLEIYSETTEGGQKLNPIQMRQFEVTHKADHIQQALQAFFNPLTVKNPNQAALVTAARPSQTFGEIYAKKRTEMLGAGPSGKGPEATTARTPAISPKPSVSLTYESLLSSLDAQMKEAGVWQKISTARTMTPSTSPASRVVKYFDHLLSQLEVEEDKGKEFTTNAKLNLLYHLMNNWLDHQLKSIRKDTPLSRQLEIYESSLEQINHVIDKIAVAINQGHPIGSEGVPETLKAKQELCQLKVNEIQEELRRRSIVAMEAFLGEKHSVRLAVATAPQVRVEEEVEGEIVVQAHGHMKTLLPKAKAWEKKWESSFEELRGLLSPDRLTEYQAEQSLLKLYDALEGLPEEKREEIKGLIEKGEHGPVVEEMMTALLFDTGAIEKVLENIFKNRRFNYQINPEFRAEFISIFKQLILCPHLIPQYDVSKVELGKEMLTFLIDRIQDSSLTGTRSSIPAFEAFNAILGIRHLISPDKREEYEKAEWENQAARFEIAKTGEGKERDEAVVKYRDCLIRLQSDLSPLTSIPRVERTIPDLKDPLEVTAENIEFHQAVVEGISTLAIQCRELNAQAIDETDLAKRKEKLQKLQEHALQALQLLPAPMAAGANGQDALWNNLSSLQRQEVAAQISTLEHFIWESQLKLAASEMDGKSRFLLIKAQVIKQALIRTEVSEIRAKVEDILKVAHREAPENIQSLSRMITIDPRTESVQLKMPVNENSIQALKTALTAIIPPGNEIPNVEMLLFDNYTLDTLYINHFLTEDLTALLSRDADMERDLIAVYRFLTKDYHVGRNTLRVKSENYPELRDRLSTATVKLEDAGCQRCRQQMLESNLMLRTVSDPDYTLYSATPVMGVPFFQAKPETFLKQRELSLAIQDNSVSINGPGHVKLAEVYVQGHPDFAVLAGSQVERNIHKMKPKKPVLPVVDNSSIPEEPHSLPGDLRTHKTYNVWVKYVEEMAQGQSLNIPPQVLLSLFLIRQAPAGLDKKYATAYASDTPIRALAFLADPGNQKYLQYDFVQKYLEESLFGSFLMQQAFMEHPDLIVPQLEILEERLFEATASKNLEAIGFINSVLQQMQTHARHTQKVLADEGLFSGLTSGLPVHMSSFGDVLFESLDLSGNLRQDKKNVRQNLAWDPAVELQFNELPLAQPFVHRLSQVSQSVAKLDELVEVATQEDSANLHKLYFAKDGQEYVIDQVKNLPMRKQMYVNALEIYRRSPPEEMTQEDLRHILIGYQLIQDPRIEGGIVPQQQRLVEWVHESVLPKFHAFEVAQRNQILTDVANTQLTRQGIPILPRVGDWVQSRENLSTYTLTPSAPLVEVNLFTMALTGFKEQEIRQQKLIPDHILRRTEVQQALKTDRIMATETKIGKQVTYAWEHDGQTFTITAGAQLKIERKVDGITYTFQPITLEKVNDNAHALLADNGYWVRNDNQRAGHVFTQGMEKPELKDKYTVGFKHAPDGTRAVDYLRASSGKVSTSFHFDQKSPLLFANSKNVIVILEPGTTTPGEFRLKNSNIYFQRNKSGHWMGFRGETRLGNIAFPKDDKVMAEYFGESWDRFVIPLRKEDGSEAYLLLPYGQKVDGKGRVSIDQNSLKEMGGVEYLTKKADGSISGTLSSELYLAHQFLQQARMTKNSTKATQLYLKADSHLKHLKLERPPSDPEQLMKLQQVIDMIKDNPISLASIPSPLALALNLRLMLTIRKIRKNVTLPVQKILIPSAKDHFQELEAMAKMYEAYCVLSDTPETKGQIEKLHKTAIRLSPDERNELVLISKQLVQEIATQMTAETYFGATGRLEGTLHMVRPESLDPQFLLALMRAAKRPDTAVDIRKVSAAMPLDELLENYWSYFISIKQHHVTPDQLVFLFQESVLPPTHSPEEEARLKAIDLQARQFLLSFANIQEMLKKDPKQTLEKEMDEAKKQINDAFGSKGLFADALGVLSPDLGSQVREICSDFNNVTVEGKVVQIGSQGKTVPDVEKLVKAMTPIEARLNQFSETLDNVVSDAEHFAGNYREKREKIETEIKKTTNTIHRTEQETQNTLKALQEEFDVKSRDLPEEQAREIQVKFAAEKEAITAKADVDVEKLHEKNELSRRELQELLSQEVQNPVNGELISVKGVTEGEFEDTVELEKLRDLSKSCKTVLKTLKEQLSNADKAKKMLDGLVQLEQCCMALQRSDFAPQPNLTFAEEEGGRRKLKELFARLEKVNFNTMSLTQQANYFQRLTREVVGDIGLKQGLGLIKQLRDYKKGDLPGKINTFATPLEAMALLYDANPIEAGVGVLPSQQPLRPQLQEILEGSFAQQCFTEGQLEKLKTHFAKLQPADQQSLTSELSKALTLHEAALAAQTGLAANMGRIDSACRKMDILTPPHLQAAHTPKPSERGDPLVKCHRESHFKDRYGEFFKGRNDFVFDQTALGGELETKIVTRDQKTGFAIIKQHLTPDHKPNVRAIKRVLGGAKYLPAVQALEVIVEAESDEALNAFMANIQECKSGVDLLTMIEIEYNAVVPKLRSSQHEKLVGDLITRTLPENADSVYTQDLRKGFENLKTNNPLPYATVIAADQIEAVRAVVQGDIDTLQADVQAQENEIVRRLKSIPLNALPKELQLIRFRQGSDQELLQAAYIHYSKGVFVSEKFDARASSPGEYNELNLDELISLCQIDSTRLKMLSTSKFNASASLDALEGLRKSRNALLKDYDLVRNPEEKKEILAQVKAIDAAWLKESNRLRDFLDRCQSTKHLTKQDFPARLKPHIRKILYLQNRRGVICAMTK